MIRRHFLPGALSVVVFHGPKRCQDLGFLTSSNVVLTTYATIVAEDKGNKLLQELKWFRIVLDEGRRIFCSRLDQRRLTPYSALDPKRVIEAVQGSRKAFCPQPLVSYRNANSKQAGRYCIVGGISATRAISDYGFVSKRCPRPPLPRRERLRKATPILASSGLHPKNREAASATRLQRRGRYSVFV